MCIAMDTGNGLVLDLSAMPLDWVLKELKQNCGCGLATDGCDPGA